jgi:Fe-S-cluster containining protein
VKSPESTKGLEGFICKRCGHCCLNLVDGYSFTLLGREARAIIARAPKVRAWLQKVYKHDLYDGWISPHTGEEVLRCPWLREYQHPRWKSKGFACLIQDSKPPICKDYPPDCEFAQATGCQGFNHL